MQEDFTKEIITFFETIEKYYGSKIEVSIGLFSEKEISNNSLATWNLLEFNLIQSGYRKTGDKFMVEGNGIYFELSAEKLINFKQTGRHKFEFIEQYNESLYRITKMRFHYKY